MKVSFETGKPLSFVFLFLLSALVFSGCSTSPTTAPMSQPGPRATVSLSISPGAVMPGQSATLTWTSADATSCTASGAWSGTVATSGSMTVMLQKAASQSYSLTCSGTGLPGQNAATLAVSQQEGACTVASAVRAHASKRSAHRGKANPAHL